jgi:hypothetical protein
VPQSSEARVVSGVGGGGHGDGGHGDGGSDDDDGGGSNGHSIFPTRQSKISHASTKILISNNE